MRFFLGFKKGAGGFKGQSLAEIAVFGSLLLMALAFLIRYAIQYNYKQQVKMESFRYAMKMAAESNVAKSQSVVLIKDVNIPNPQDRFAYGDRTTFKEDNNVFWSNNTTGISYTATEASQTEQFPSVKYIFNPDNNFDYTILGAQSGSRNVKKDAAQEYTTAGLIVGSGTMALDNSLILKGYSEPKTVSSKDDIRVYQPEDELGDSSAAEVKVLLNTGADCTKEYCQTAILDQVEFAKNAAEDRRYFPVQSVAGESGKFPDSISFLDSEGGQMNTAVGKQQTENTYTQRSDSQAVTEGTALRSSKDTLNEIEAVTHVIKINNGGVADDSPTVVFKNTTANTWTNSK